LQLGNDQLAYFCSGDGLGGGFPGTKYESIIEKYKKTSNKKKKKKKMKKANLTAVFNEKFWILVK
jgi:hypothetical protein